MTRLVYFARIREQIGRNEEELELPAEVRHIDDLLEWLKGRGEEYAQALAHDNYVRVAMDRRHVSDRRTAIAGAREIAIFPPMSGG